MEERPALRRGRRLAPSDPEAARVECFFGLMAARLTRFPTRP